MKDCACSRFGSTPLTNGEATHHTKPGAVSARKAASSPCSIACRNAAATCLGVCVDVSMELDMKEILARRVGCAAMMIQPEAAVAQPRCR